MLTVTVLELLQTPCVIVHLSTTEFEGNNPVTVVVGEFIFVIFAVPDTIVQVPMPTVGILAASVALVEEQRF